MTKFFKYIEPNLTHLYNHRHLLEYFRYKFPWKQNWTNSVSAVEYSYFLIKEAVLHLKDNHPSNYEVINYHMQIDIHSEHNKSRLPLDFTAMRKELVKSLSLLFVEMEVIRNDSSRMESIIEQEKTISDLELYQVLRLVNPYTHVNGSPRWKIISPEGKEYLVERLNKFCEANNLVLRELKQVAKGERKDSSGWKCMRLG